MAAPDEENYSVYCEKCGACGEEGCCSPIKCKATANCMYPHYLDILKDAYHKYGKICDVIFNSDEMAGDAYRLLQIEEIIRGEDVL